MNKAHTELDPRSAVIYFDIYFNMDSLEEDARDGDQERKQEAKELLNRIEASGGRAVVQAELRAKNEVGKLLKVRVLDEGHADDVLDCKFDVGTYDEVARIHKEIFRHVGGGDDIIYLDTPYCEARGFTLFPKGINGPKIGAESGLDMDWDDWLKLHKPRVAPRRKR